MKIKIFDKLFYTNLIWLFSIRIGRILAPLILIPIISSSFGNSSLGTYLLFLSIANWISLVIDYGFVFSATKEVARERDCEKSLQAIFMKVTSAKTMLITICIPFFFISSYLVSDLWLCIVAGFLSGVVTGLVPLWYFQGVERSKIPAFLDLIFYISLIPAAIVCMWLKLDIYYLIFLYIILRTVVLIYSTIIVVSEIKLTSFTFSYGEAKSGLKAGFGMALFRFSTTMYITLNSIVVGLLLTPLALVVFSIPEKITRGAVALLSPLSQAIFPRLSYNLKSGSTDAFKATGIITVIVGSIITCLIFFFAPKLISLFLSEDIKRATMVLEYLSILPVLISISNTFGLQYLVTHGYEIIFNRIIMLAAALNLGAIYPLISYFDVEGAAFSLIITEAYVAIATCIYFCILQRSR